MSPFRRPRSWRAPHRPDRRRAETRACRHSQSANAPSQCGSSGRPPDRCWHACTPRRWTRSSPSPPHRRRPPRTRPAAARRLSGPGRRRSRPPAGTSPAPSPTTRRAARRPARGRRDGAQHRTVRRVDDPDGSAPPLGLCDEHHQWVRLTAHRSKGQRSTGDAPLRQAQGWRPECNGCGVPARPHGRRPVRAGSAHVRAVGDVAVAQAAVALP